MLKELAKQKGEIFENFFTEAFENRFNVECDWGFPVISLSIKSKEESEIKNHWVFWINTTTEEYSFTSEGYREEGEGENKKITILPVSIDSNTINFIVKNVVSITKEIFEPNKTTETENETEIETEIEVVEEK